MDVDLTRSTSPFSLKIKLLRGVWTYLVWPLFRYLPRGGSPLRVAMLRLFGASIGPRCLIEPGVQVWLPWNLHLEGFVAIGRDVEIYNYGLVSIRRMSVVSQYTYLCTGTHDHTHPHMPLTWAPITIGSECWIAAQSFVGPGVSIGDRSLVGACSVVTKSLPEGGIYGGNPARYIKPRVIKAAAAG